MTAHRVAALVRTLPAATLDAILARLDEPDASQGRVLACVSHGATAAALRSILEEAELPTVAAMIRGARAMDATRAQDGTVDLVWTGPHAPSSTLYRTEQTLLNLIAEARRSLLIVTFAAYDVESVREALQEAITRGVRVDLVVEQAKVSVSPLAALGGAETGLHVWEWPEDKRPVTDKGKSGTLHAKCAVADDDVLFVSSANLTGHALEVNMELGVLVRGGALPRQVREHFEGLMRKAVLGTAIGIQ